MYSLDLPSGESSAAGCMEKTWLVETRRLYTILKQIQCGKTEAGLATAASGQLSYHRCQRLGGIGSLANRAADHQIIRAYIQRLTRSQNTALVILGAAGRTNPRRHQLQRRVSELQRLRFLSRTHQAIQTGLCRQPSETQHLRLRFEIQANARK